MTPRRRPPTTEMRVEPWPIDRVTPYAANPRKNSGAVAKVARAIANSTMAGELVVDPFAGSGTTLLACAATGRRAALIEIDPRYCDVIVQRWESATGQEATRP